MNEKFRKLTEELFECNIQILFESIGVIHEICDSSYRVTLYKNEHLEDPKHLLIESFLFSSGEFKIGSDFLYRRSIEKTDGRVRLITEILPYVSTESEVSIEELLKDLPEEF